MCDYVFDSGDNEGETCNKTIFKLTRCKTHKIKEEKKTYPKCIYLFTKGEKRDTLCNKNVLEEGEELCKPHKNAKLKKIELTKTEDYKKCECIVLSGPNKGNECGKTIKDNNIRCAAHMKVKGDASKVNECKFKITRGQRKGEDCGKRCIGDDTLCNSHKKSNELTTTNLKKANINEFKCSYMYKRGAKKGQACDASCYDDNILCKTHLKTSNSSEIESVISKSSTKSSTKVARPAKLDDEDEEKSEHTEKCIYKITRGSRSGESCGLKSSSNSNYCSKHKEPSVKSTTKSNLLEEDEEKVVTKVLKDIKQNLPESLGPCKFRNDGKKCTKIANINSDYCKIHKSFGEKGEEEEDDLLKMIGNELDNSDEEDIDDE